MGDAVSDTPIYDRLAAGDPLNPFKHGRKSRRGIVSGLQVATVELESGPTEALNRINENHHEEAVAALEPFGLHPYDIARPTYRRVVYEGETR